MHMLRLFFVYHITGSTYYTYLLFSSYEYLKDIYNTLKGIGKIQFVSQNLKLFKFHGNFLQGKIWNYKSSNTSPYVGKSTLVQYILLILTFTVFEEQCLAQRFCKMSGKVTSSLNKRINNWRFSIFCVFTVLTLGASD